MIRWTLSASDHTHPLTIAVWGGGGGGGAGGGGGKKIMRAI
ncbi:hypothetical protein [Nocardia abscessus]|nr:hypothetical protein [Nocardia abscessus]